VMLAHISTSVRHCHSIIAQIPRLRIANPEKETQAAEERFIEFKTVVRYNNENDRTAEREEEYRR